MATRAVSRRRSGWRAAWASGVAAITLIASMLIGPVATAGASDPVAPADAPIIDGPLIGGSALGAVKTGSAALAAVGAGVDKPDYRPLEPARIADSRSGYKTVDGRFRGTGFVSPTAPLTLDVLNRAGVPASGVVAVALNVTVTQAQASGHLTVYPTGQSQPKASNINYVRGDTVANSVVVKVGTGGRVTLYAAAATHVIVDVTGFFTAGGIQAINPARLVDTRPGYSTSDGAGAGGGAVRTAAPLDVIVTNRVGIPASGVTAVALNVVAVTPTSSGYLTVYPTGVARPVASNVNFVRGRSAANSVIVKVGSGGRVRIYTSAGPTHLVVDVAGYFTNSSTFVPLTPARYADSRRATGVVAGPSSMTWWTAAGDGMFGPMTGGYDPWAWPPVPHSRYTRLDVPISDRAGIPGPDIGAVVLNVTATGGLGAGHLTVFPTGSAAPNASSVNFTKNSSTPNLVIAKIGRGGFVSILSPSASTNIIVDVLGYFPAMSSEDDPDVWTALQRDDVGMAISYDRCEPLRYRINPQGAKPGWIDDIVAAIDIIANVTGLTFQRLPDTTEVPVSVGPRPTTLPDGTKNPVLIAFPTQAMVPGLGGALGIGGSTYLSGYDGPNFNPSVFYTGIAYFDRDADVPSGFGAQSFGPLALHELGHMVGLGHVLNESEVMYPVLVDGSSGFGPGDLHGLRMLYRTQSCPNSPATYPPVAG